MATEEQTPLENQETSQNNDQVEDTKLAINMLAQGKRNVICGEIPLAVNQFQEACALLAKHYGETAKECAEAYYCYGQSLLDLARMETGVLGNALQGVDVEDETETKPPADEQFETPETLKGEEREKLRIEVYDAMAEKEGAKKGEENGTEGDKMEVEATDRKEDQENKENSENVEQSSKPEKPETDAGESSTAAKTEECAEDEEEGEEEEVGDEDEEAEEDGGEGTSEQKEGEDADGDDVSNLQLAWEMLELAKMIYIKDTTKENQLKAAQAYLKLGEVSLETEQYEQATEDFKACLEIQKKHLEATDRLLAESHYQLGLSFGFDKKYDESIEHYRAAIKVIEDKIALLEKEIEEKSTGKGKELASTDDPVTAAQQEIKDLKEILPDIASKIEDAEEEKKNLQQLKDMTKEIVSGTITQLTSSESSSSASTIEVKKASDISHLIRRKRKPDDDADETETKKSRQEEGSGDAPQQNGHGKESKKEEAEVAEPEAMATS